MTNETIPVAMLLQIYAPLAGLLGVAFWLGVLTQRVKISERRQDKTDERLGALDDDKFEVGRRDEKLTNVENAVADIKRDIHAIQRTLANLASGQTVITEMERG